MAATSILNRRQNCKIGKYLGGEVLYLSLGTSTDSIAPTPTHATISRGPAVGNNKEPNNEDAHYLGGGKER